MKKSIKVLFQNISWSVISSMVSMVVSTLVILIVPKVVSAENYGYYQLYSLYIGYVGFFQFGFVDGIFIRYGGKYYNDINKKKMFSQFVFLCISQSIVAILIALISILVFHADKRIVFIFVAIELFLANVRGMLTYVLQATNRIKEGAVSNTIGRIVFFLLVAIFCILKYDSYLTILSADICGRCVALFYSIYKCRDIVFRKPSDFSFDFYEIKENIRIGFFLMLSSIASLLIIGIVRIFMENKWGIETFAKISLTISVSNLMVQFINAVSLVCFPVLRRVSETTIKKVYSNGKVLLMLLMYFLLLLYYPISKLLLLWLPQYNSGLMYMALLFPMCVYESRMSLINYTFLKVFSKTKPIFYINLLSFICSISISAITVFLLENITLSMIAILISIVLRCVLADIYISNYNNSKCILAVLEEIVLMLIFILSSWYINNGFSVLIYFVALIIFIVINISSIKESLIEFKKVFIKDSSEVID